MMKTERWKPEDNQKYYFISNMLTVVENNYIAGYEFDGLRYETGNCFKTAAEAEAAAAKVKALLLSLHEPTTNCNQLPKLTAEVFNRPDCPEWAKYAAVSSDGRCLVCREYPILIGGRRWANPESYWEKTIDGKFDTTDWQNSLIKRPAKLPDWCKVGEWVYCTQTENYGKILSVDAEQVNIRLSSNETFSAKTNMMLKYGEAARLRQYTADEMRELVGKVFEDKDGNLYLAVSYIPHGRGLLVGGYYFNAGELLDANFTIDGKPCGKFEHLEDGEWVK